MFRLFQSRALLLKNTAGNIGLAICGYFASQFLLIFIESVTIIFVALSSRTSPSRERCGTIRFTLLHIKFRSVHIHLKLLITVFNHNHYETYDHYY